MSLTRGRSALLLVLLGALSAVTAGPTWVRAETSTAIDPTVAVAVSGGTAAPAVNAAAFVLVAAGLALAITGRVGRRVVLVVAAAAGALVAFSAVSVALAPTDVAREGAVAAANVTDLTRAASVTAWPWLSAAVGVLAVAAAVVVWLAARRWTATSSRHERADAAAPVPAQADAAQDTPVDTHDAWDALTRGADPTAPQER